jgi:hypothetical protein
MFHSLGVFTLFLLPLGRPNLDVETFFEADFLIKLRNFFATGSIKFLRLLRIFFLSIQFVLVDGIKSDLLERRVDGDGNNLNF